MGRYARADTVVARSAPRPVRPPEVLMPSSRLDEARDYAFADQTLALRKHASLTQRDLAALLGVTERAVGAWETGLSYPAAERLQQLIALYLQRGAFAAGHEAEEAAALWETVRARASRRLTPFDPRWFASLPGAGGVPTAPPAPTPVPVAAADLPPRRHEWGEAPDVPALQGRAKELATLARWVDVERCRLVVVLGAGGIGKTALVARLAHDLAPAFPVIYWRSLRNALPVQDWLAGALAAFATLPTPPPDSLEARLTLLLDLLRTQRALLVLDNLETVLAPEAPTVRYRPGYEGYGELLRRLAEGAHQGCVIVTSREKPLREGGPAVRALRLGGLGVRDGRALLARRALVGDDAAWRALVARYTGNPLALSVVAETIATVFGGHLAAFLAQDTAVFGDIRLLLDEQVARLSALEQAILTTLAVARESVGFAALVADVGPAVARGAVVEAVEALGRRSLLEEGAGGTFTVQPVVLEHATAHLIEQVGAELVAGTPALLVRQALLKAQAPDYVRRAQERLIVQPLLTQLRTHLGSADAVERALLALLTGWRGRPAEEQGYGPGNVVNLLRLLRGDLRRLDLSHLAIRQAYLQGVEAQDASLAGAHLSEAVLDQAFNDPTAVALSADGALLAAGTSSGEVFLWRVADRTPLLALAGHTGGVWSVALSGDGRLL
jgi:transcriptional regulator with XRE-family HTH domain